MVSVPSLWLPIVVSAVLVFVASSIIHMALGYHRADYRKLPAEDAVRDALRPFDIPPGDYMVPCHGGGANRAEFTEKLAQGPNVIMTVIAPGKPNMGPQLAQWFLYSVVAGVFAAYVAGRALGPGADYLSAFRFAGCTAFVGYSLAGWPDSIWYKRSWGTTLRNSGDGLVYGLLTGGAFGWLWPR